MITLGFGVAGPASISAQVADRQDAAAEFSLEAAKSETEDEVIVSVFAKGVSDVYAYEVRLGYEPSKLELVDTVSGLPGMSVNPILNNNQIRFGHTQIGKVPGKSGDLKLVSFIFKKLHKGNSAIRLDAISLVESSLESMEFKPGHLLQVEDTTVAIRLTDIGGHWAEEAIERAVSLGFVEGYTDHTFRPQREVTRAEFVTLLSRALQLAPLARDRRLFDDDSQFPVWAKAHIYAAAEQELILAYEDHTFRAARPITRVEMTTIIARSIAGESETGELTYKDREQIPAWGYDAVAVATAAGLVQGKPDQRFAPNERSTRAEVVVLILNVLDAMQ